MSRYYGGWAPYVPVAERRRRALLAMEKRRRAGHPVAPVTITGRAIATTFWGQAWCDNMESYHDYENRLPRGRTYVRNGSVVDLQIATGRVTAVVSGSELYNVTITIRESQQAHWRSICTDCAGGIDSLVELLQGRFSKGVMERLCRQESGLFPRPADIRFSCSCPDHALMCKHVAAVLYGVGARLDQSPELLFRLRAVNEADLVAHVDAALPMSKHGPASGRVLEAEDVSALFGLDMAAPQAVEQPAGKPAVARGRVAPPRSNKAASAAGAVVARPIAPNRTVAVRKGPVELVRAKGGPVAVTAPPGKRPAPKPALAKTASAPPSVPRTEAAIAVGKGKQQKAAAGADRERRKARDTGDDAGGPRRSNSALVAKPVALTVPARSHGLPPAQKSKATTAQKPVKWW